MQISSPLQSCVLQSRILHRYFEVGFGHLPFPRMGRVTRLYFSWNPPLHATEQGDHLDHLLSLQLRSQEPVLHGRDSWTVFRDIPTFSGTDTMLRARP